jgi:hypothetical protein
VWNPSIHTDDENTRWCWLRAVEWGRWPLFASQLFAPVLLIFTPWQYVAIGFFVANILWHFIRYNFVSTGLADAMSVGMLLKWPVTLVSAAILAWHQQNFGVATLVLVWPLVAILLGIVTPTEVGRIQQVMMAQLGYDSAELPSADGGSGFERLSEMKRRSEERRNRIANAVQAAESQPDVGVFLAERNLPPDALEQLCRLLLFFVPDERQVFKALQNVDMLAWFFSMPGLSWQSNLHFPDEQSQVLFVNWVRYGRRHS